MFSNSLSSCRRHSQNAYRSLTTQNSAPVASTSLSPETIRPKRPPRPELTTAIVLNRSPIITRTPTPFERAYYAYQTRIARALHNPFPYDFYFKQGSPLEARFNIEERKRERKAFGKPFSDQSMGDNSTSITADQLGPQEGEGETMMPRIHDADTKLDFKSLDRRGQRNLYLLLNKHEGKKMVWKFPQGDVEQGELLHQAAQRDMHAECGPYMDTWMVSRNPIGVYEPPSPLTELDDSSSKKITFFFKAHIMAGNVRPSAKDVIDFAWLTKQEIQTKVEEDYWLGVKDMLSDF